MDPFTSQPGVPHHSTITGETDTTGVSQPPTGYGTVNSLTDTGYGGEVGQPSGMSGMANNLWQGASDMARRVAANKQALWIIGGSVLGLIVAQRIRHSEMGKGLSEIKAGRNLIRKGQDLVDKGRARMSWRQMAENVEED